MIDIQTMSVINGEDGFTVVEVVTTLAIMGLFIAFMYLTFFTGQSQQLNTVRLAAANDLAQANLRKITDKGQVQSGVTDSNNIDTSKCNALNDVTGSATYVPSPSPAANPAGAPDHSTQLQFTSDSLPPSLSPSDTKQYLYVRYPQGCNPLMPAQIVSVVMYGSEIITRTSYVTTKPTN